LTALDYFALNCSTVCWYAVSCPYVKLFLPRDAL